MATVKQPDCTIKTPPDHPRHEEEKLDEAIQETFPASDPVSVTIGRSPEERGQPSKLDRLDEMQKQKQQQEAQQQQESKQQKVPQQQPQQRPQE